ncbi:rho GTPase-activating protein 21-like isoform X1 [Periophthalmus magnuspinnatus]|uniref:rho GTPase-activating protein 21-like isoform X1 n=1 Tax=Periophthalmus magnuspinnatus TaxID=409849 RepID=UPI00145B123D|nr:rho GTPase-activating protein 21-like isoform X1 [Periophthalmus magnuspinnatus]
MLARRNGPVPLKDLSEMLDVEVTAEGCCSLSPSPASGGCPWARLAGVDGCLSEPYCLWFQLLARAYWGEVEIGLSSPNRSVSWARLREASIKNCVRSRAKQKDGREQSEGSVLGSPVPEEEPFSWPGPKTLHLRRTSQGFGFTLRHFIVYPPESAVHNSLKDEENGSRGRQRNRLEPMDTIFVKQVKEGGPAHGAGLCTGDRIVKVNGESIIGKTYSQVIALIQNSNASLELCVMPKDEDILQLAYSQDAYLKGNEAYSGNARNIPAPPPICYPRIEVKAASMAQGAIRTTEKNYRVEIPVPPSPSAPPITIKSVICNDILRTPSHRTEENRFGTTTESAKPRSTVPSVSGGVQLQYPSIDTPVYSQTPTSKTAQNYPETLSPNIPVTLASQGTKMSPNNSPSASASNTPTHQNIDWKNYTTYKDYIDSKKLHTYGSRTIQERLDSLRAAANSNVNSVYKQPHTPPLPNSRVFSSQVRRRSASHDRGVDAACKSVGSLRSLSQERLSGGERTAKNWHRSASQDAIPSSVPAGVAKMRTRSCDYIGHRVTETGGCVNRTVGERAGHGEDCKVSRQTASGITNSPVAASVFTKGSDPSKADGLIIRPSRLPVKNSDFSPALSSAQGPMPLKDQRTTMMGNHVGYTSPVHLLRTRADSLKIENRTEGGLAARSSSCSGVSSKVAILKQQQTVSTAVSSITNGAIEQQPKAISTLRTKIEGVEGLDATVVVLRREKKSDAQPNRPPSYVCAVNERNNEDTQRPPVLVKAGSEGAMCRDTYFRRLEDTKQKTGSRLDGSLDSIPFIDEPSSPSIDQDSSLISASAVISVPPIITTIPPSPTSPSPLIRRQLSHDQDSMRLTIIDSDSGTKTERSKSCDEGLDNYREERKGRSLIPGLKNLRKAVDRSSEDSGSRRDSSSDIFCDATKEGLLHFRQLSSEKGKRVGGGMRPWKQMYAVLRGHYLCLYKERKEGQGQTNCQTVEEPLPISIKACLIDISYSDTKRKNVLRITTSDSEYLFQAEDREDMLAWIKVIQENSMDEENAAFTSHDLISRKIKEYNTLMSPTGTKSEPSPRSSRQSLSIRQTLLGGKAESKTPSPKAEQERKSMHKDDTSPPKDKGTWRKGIPGLMRKPFEKKPSPGVTFGVRLDDCPPAHNNKYVPLIVEVCCKLVEERGLEYTGIYRVPGNNAAISNMQEELNNKGMGDIDVQDDKWRDLNVISSLLKSFFRKLPEPLFTNEKYADFIEANRIEDPVVRLKELKRLLHELPDHHYETLKFLSAHLKTVAENSEKNKMEPRNLAIVFGPTLVRTTEDNMTHMVTHMPDQYKIVETLIQNYDWFFTDDGSGEPVTASQEESAVESQPVPNIDHLLTNIGRTGTSQGEVSDSPTSDSAKSKGSWGSGKDQYSRELLVSSIFAAASRKRKKSKEKPQPSSSDDDLDSVFTKKDTSTHKPAEINSKGSTKQQIAERKENGRTAELAMKTKKEHRNFLKDLAKHPLSTHSNSGNKSPIIIRLGKPSLSDPPSIDETSDLGTMSSGASVPLSQPKKGSVSLSEVPLGAVVGAGASLGAEVSSITSDYSTNSSITFLTGAESSVLSPELQGGEEADDERSELISEGRPMETDSESEFPVFAPTGGNSQSTPCPGKSQATEQGKPEAKVEGNCGQRMESRRLFPSHKLIDGDTLSRRWSLRNKTDSESSVEGVVASGERSGEGRSESSTRLSRVLEVMRKGRSTSSLSSSSRSESERSEPAWHLKITERLKFRLRTSADDMFSIQKNPETRSSKKKNIRRRHTMGGQRDFAELAVINDWREQGGMDQAADISTLENFKPRFSSQDFAIKDWTPKERSEGAKSNPQLAPKAMPEDECLDSEQPAPPAASSSAPQSAGMNGSGVQSKAVLGADAHPHKLSGAQVVRSRFYQYL